MADWRKELFLADCLLELIEEENYELTKALLIEHKADCNLIIPGREIAAIHYAAGMENTLFGENVMKLMLKNGGNPNVKTPDGETPLHVAAFGNRELIVQMLLDHGGDYTIEDSDGNTAINNAIIEKHFNLIPIFQSYVFEMKLQNRTESRRNGTSNQSPTARRQLPSSAHHLEIPRGGGFASPRSNNLLTPNKTNYNFAAASPFMVNITQRRKPNRPEVQNKVNPSPLRRTISVDPDIVDAHATYTIEKHNKSPKHPLISSDEEDDVVIVQENLFQLTQSNLEKHLKSTPKQNRISLVNTWRNKVNKSRRRESIVPVKANVVELDSFIMKHTGGFSTISSSQLSTPISSDSSVATVVAAPGNKNKDEKEKKQDREAATQSEGSDSFVTAEANGYLDANAASPIMRSPDTSKAIVQMAEAYMHTDTENNIVFYEQKLLANPVLRKSFKSSNANESATASESCPETELTIPLDYDTDDLRTELTQFGEVPGPITKSTKRLYMKRLIKYQRKPAEAAALNRGRNKATPNFSIELKKTLRSENNGVWQEWISQYCCLERQMIEGFLLGSSKRCREGNLKTSFNYLLIDPRISENLPGESQLIPKHTSWQRFISSIFYVGKGKSSRPYAHLYDAIKIYQDKRNEAASKYHDSLKLERINDIWKSGKGVICLPVFHNIMPVEAYTREAAIIDCIGVENLTNIKRGDYYGISKSWNMRQRKQLGISLLYKAMHIFMAEGESQLRPDDIQQKK